MLNLPKTTTMGLPVIATFYSPKITALSVSLFCIYTYLKERRLTAFILLIILINLYPLYGSIITCLLFVSDIRKTVNKPQIIMKLLIFWFTVLLFSFPLLNWLTNNLNKTPFFAPDQWLLALRLTHPFFEFFHWEPPYLLIWITLTIQIALFFLGYHSLDSKKEVFLTLFLTSISLFIIGTIFSDLFPITYVIVSQITRVCIFVTIFCQIAFAHYLTKIQKSNVPFQNYFLLFLIFINTFSYILTITAAALVIYKLFQWYQNKTISKKNPTFLNPVKLIITTSFCFLLYLSFFSLTAQHQPLEIQPPSNTWTEIIDWARTKTDLDSLFLIPPYFSDLTVFQPIAERSVLVNDIQDAGGTGYHPKYSSEWLTRMDELSNNNIRFFTNGAASDLWLPILIQGFNSLTSNQLWEIVKKYNVDYVVLIRGHKFIAPIVFQNPNFTIYQCKN